MSHVPLRTALREAIRSLLWVVDALDTEDKEGR